MSGRQDFFESLCEGDSGLSDETLEKSTEATFEAVTGRKPGDKLAKACQELCELSRKGDAIYNQFFSEPPEGFPMARFSHALSELADCCGILNEIKKKRDET